MEGRIKKMKRKCGFRLWHLCMLTVILGILPGCQGKEPDLDALYRSAIKDAVFADTTEIQPLVSLTPEDKRTTWDSEGRVLVCTWHRDAASYPEGKTIVIEDGPVWVFTDKEIASYKEELKKCKAPETRLAQLIGLPPDCGYSAVTGFWVNPADVIRPAYQTDASSGEMTTSFVETADEAFKEWFNGNIIGSYFEGAYPWTRLGYTYDWADNGTEYGLTEFLVLDGAEVTVEFTEMTEEFLRRITG